MSEDRLEASASGADRAVPFGYDAQANEEYDVEVPVKHVQPQSWRYAVLSAFMLVTALGMPGLAAPAWADQLDRPAMAQPRPPDPLPPNWSILLSTESGQPGTEVRVDGSNWWAGKDVELHWGSPDGPLLGEATPAVQRSPSPGTFTLTFTVPDVPPGVYDVWAVGGEPGPAGPPGGFGSGLGGLTTRGVGFKIEPATFRTSFVVVSTQPDGAPAGQIVQP